MKIKGNDNSPSKYDYKTFILNFLRSEKVIICVLFMVLNVGVLFGLFFGEFCGPIDNVSPTVKKFAQNTLYSVGINQMQLVGIIQENYKIPLNYYDGQTSNPETLFIDIKNNDFQKLAYKREVALENGILVSSDDDYVPATINTGNTSVDVKLRLKGDWTDHLKGDKWSFRVKVKGDNTLFGMKAFSLQDPVTRNYLYEWIFQQAIEKEDIISPRYSFVDVTINGKENGIYALEEFFDKRLIENNELREGPIVRFNEDLVWEGRIEENPLPEESYYASDIDSFQTTDIIDDPVNYANYIKAKDLLESFRRGNLTTSAVFDTEKLAKYFALSDIFGGQHGHCFHNYRFYYNPITSKLEPIGFDSNSGNQIVDILGVMEVELYRYTYFFKDPIFYAEYVKQLETYSDETYLITFFDEIDGELQSSLNIIYKDNPLYHFSNLPYYSNQIFINKKLNPIKGLNAYYNNNDNNSQNNTLILKVGNIQTMPIEIIDLKYGDSTIFTPKNATIFWGKITNEPVQYENVEFILPADFMWNDEFISEVSLNYRLLGHSRVRNESVFPWPYLSEDFPSNDLMRQTPNYDDCEFLSIDEKTKTIVVQPGTWEINHNVIIPEDYSVICYGDIPTKLDLRNGAIILSYSPIQFIGSEDYPIFITSSDSSGQGIVVLDTDERSRLEYVRFSNLSAPSQDGWQLSGSVTFYNSDVDIENCVFSDNKYGDDMVDLVRSEYSVKNSLFQNIYSDAIDDDFGKGNISQTSFVGCGNDALDFSGSYTDINNCYMKETGDKAVSGGEGSHISVNDIVIEDCNVGIASKDQSVITIENLQISSCVIGFTAYQKKSEFGPSEIFASNVEMTDVTIPSLIEIDSQLTLNGDLISGTEKDVYANYYDGEATIETY
ncbi:CotH kinase family protein [Methanogenium marinum]|uniref:CotH kinase family protein n=1 Tax=Methanogenium marinum TaxID=348610 RepID=A0A9Q4KSG4_9EURY|nr:CotH kinase family protein [Methanogenium marinum]MDE4907726.1 CotH kinase family protein [Methanogenium marinum]